MWALDRVTMQSFDEFVDSYVKLKNREWNDYSRHLTEWERAATLDC